MQETNLKSTFIRNASNKISAIFNARTSYQGVDLEVNLDGAGTIVGEVKPVLRLYPSESRPLY